MVVLKERSDRADVVHLRLFSVPNGGDPCFDHVEDGILDAGVVGLSRLSLKAQELG